MKYTPKIRGVRVRLVISERVLAQWWRLVAFMKATNLHHIAMRTVVPPHRVGHQKGQQRYGASLGGQKTLKRNIFKSFLMSNL